MLLEQLSYECYLTNQLEEALDVRLLAVELHSSAGATERVGSGLRWLSRLSWFLGRSADAESFAQAAVGVLEPLEAGTGSAGTEPAGSELAMAYSNMSQLRMLGGSSAESVEWGRRALAVARAIGNREVEAHALNNVGTSLVQLGDGAAGREHPGQIAGDLARRRFGRARRAGLDQHRLAAGEPADAP